MPLAATYDSLRQEIGRHLGYTGSLSAITSITEHERDVEAILLRGQRKFYFLRKPGEGVPYHVWSFLLRDMPLTLPAEAEAVDLPADFWHLEGNLLYGPGVDLPAISIVPEEDVRSLRSQSDATGSPRYAAIRARSTIDGQRYEAIFYPRPNAAYELRGRYACEPPMLSSETPYPAGGALHSETLLMACLCAADEKLNPEQGGSAYCEKFNEALASSIAADRAMTPQADEAAWPLDADESDPDLGVTRRYLDRQIALILKFGPNPAAWTHGQRSEIARVRERGLRRFYSPDILPGEQRQHRWSYLHPKLQLALEAGRDTYDLPVNVSSVSSSFTFEADGSVRRSPIVVVSEPQVRHALSANPSLGQPRTCAMRPKVPLDGQPMGMEVLFYPSPDSNYVLEYRANLNPFSVGENAQPLGSPEHAEAILVACLAVAEEHVGETRGPNSKRWPELLRASVIRDRERAAPHSQGLHTTWQGFPGDYDDGRSCDEPHPYASRYVTYRGEIP